MPKRLRDQILVRTERTMEDLIREIAAELAAERGPGGPRLGTMRRSLEPPTLYRGIALPDTRGSGTPFVPEPAPGTSVPLPRAVTGATIRLSVAHQCPAGDIAPADATFCPHCGVRLRP